MFILQQLFLVRRGGCGEGGVTVGMCNKSVAFAQPCGKKESYISQFFSVLLTGAIEEFFCLMRKYGRSLLWACMLGC